MKKILGLDLGTNSIGWALVQQDFDNTAGQIMGMGSRIIPMTQDVLDTFSGGKPLETQTAARTIYRSVRRLRERHLLRRERLHRVLNVLGFLPEHYASKIDFSIRLGQFLELTEFKLAYNNREFVFKKSFLEMVNEFKQSQPQLFYTKPNGEETKIPYDWTIYYLRKKALTQRIEKEELAWLILNFNQKRGYYQLRGEEDLENTSKLVEFHSIRIIDVIADSKPNNKGEIWYSIKLENGWIYRRSSKTPLFDWKDKIRDFIVTTDLNVDGSVKTDKDGNEKRSFRAPSEDDWTLMKKKTEKEIVEMDKTVGAYIYDTLLQNPTQKIRGKLVRTIERKFYKNELITILKKQIELQPELFTDDLYNDCVRELYRSNEAQQMVLSKRNFVHLFVEDIIFYQRPLKSQKSSIGNCTLEYRKYKDKDGNETKEYLKTTPKSNPLYQEFRVWQWLYNLKIYRKEDDTDVTADFLNTVEDWGNLFDFLMQQKEVNHKDILKHILSPLLKEKYPTAKSTILNKELEKEIAKYRWNYVFDNSKEKEDDKSKKYPCNTTGYEIRKRLEKVENVPSGFLTFENEQYLWHIIYSVTDKKEFETALATFANKYHLDENSFVENFRKFPPFKSEYGAFSEKAVKKLLPLMRLGKHWDWEAIDAKIKDRISKIINGEYDVEIQERVRVKTINLTENNHFQGLQLWLAQYVVYGRHSEADIAGKWQSVNDLEKYLQDFKQHSLRNPIVEQVVTETLRVVRDIWKQYGQGAKDFFDEIHVELGRDMKNTAEERTRITNTITENENTNLRIKALLAEMFSDSDVENVRPYSPVQQEILKIYEDGVLNSGIDIEDDILKISKTAQPTKSELQRYKLWLEQKYRSPYTGQIISLGKLFTEEYQIEHVIPKSRYFDDSFNNKVICEAAVNQLKDKQLGLEFIKNHSGEVVELGLGKIVRIFTEDEYKNFVKDQYGKSNSKRRNLLLDEIPEKMIERQMNDTRYISKFVSALLSNIVRADKDDDGINSKNLIPVTGKITTALKQDWGLNDVWNDLILPRFERMNELTKSQDFTLWNEKHQKYLPTVPLELSKNFNRKRIDHRHHAMDALVVACATRSHVNLLNNQSAKSEKSRYDLQYKLRNTEKWVDRNGKERDKFTEFIKPWKTFTVDARNELEKIVVSFKQNLRVINKATNQYEKYVNGKKIKVNQEGVNWAIRKPMHKETVFAKVSLRKIKQIRLSEALKDWKMIVDKDLKQEIKRLIRACDNAFNPDKINKYFKDLKYQFKNSDISKVDVYYFEDDIAAVRKALDTSFNEKFIKESVTDTGIQRILFNHLFANDNNPELAFSPEGIEDMNKNIVQLNNGKQHQPISKVRVYETVGNKFAIGTKGNKKDKYVEAAKGTNLFFAVYEYEEYNKKEDKKEIKRSYETLSLNVVIEHQKWRTTLEKKERDNTPMIPVNLDKGKLLFYLSPSDLVYLPMEDEILSKIKLNANDIKINRIYKFTDSSGIQASFIPSNIADVLFNYNKDKQKKASIDYPIQNEIGVGSQGSKNQNAITGEMIKTVCIKLNIDRLGNITL